MKNRDYKEFALGEYYHIYNRGNGKMDIFKDDQDYLNFLKRLKMTLGLTRAVLGFPVQGRPSSRIQPLPDGSFDIVCYCLMPNHFHFLIKQNTELPISKLISKLCTSYSMYFNKKYKHVGGVFQDKFKAVWVEDNEQLLWLSEYIHQNPKVAGLIENNEQWQWGSYADYLNLRQGNLCTKDSVLGQFKSTDDYRKFVESSFESMVENKSLQKMLLDIDM